ncbi:putative peptidase [bacterium BMS3Abin03]|nr:putative peptidase [bacterium BMS3Abin03]
MIKYFIESIIFSYSQIFFCNRKWFGIVALLATFILPELGILALAGVVISNIIAIWLRFDKTKIRNGFYGFNGILLGAASSFYFELTPFLIGLIFVFIIITFFVSAVLEHHFASVFNLPGLSLPFIISLYIFFLFLRNYDFIHYKEFAFIDYSFLGFLPDIVKTYFKTYSLIMFQSSILSGIILAVAVLFFSRVLFVNSIIAFAFNYLFLSIIFPKADETLLILTGFNSILTAFALGGSLIIVSRKSFLLIIISSLMVIIFAGFFYKLLAFYFLPILVLPFNAIVLSTLYSLKFRQEHSDLVLLYFQPGSPEENYYYHNVRKNRFERFKFLFPELPFFGEWFITQGHDSIPTHKEDWKYAWDFEIKDEQNSLFKDEGDSVEDYYCYNLPVAATLDGKVDKVVNHISDNKIGNVNLKNNWGNTVIIDHGKGLFSALSHLKAEEINVEVGDEVKKGEIIGKCGNSGRSPVPHLHFQFQASDKVGCKTYKFPIAHYIERKEDDLYLKTFDFPAENTFVRNLEIHKTIKQSFDFKYGDKYKFECNLNDKIFTEEWEVKVNIFNNLYIENDRGATAYFYPYEKIFYFTNFMGNKKSALYYFYLLAAKVPLSYHEKLKWDDSFPLSLTTNNLTRYLSEFFLMIGQQIKSRASIEYPERAEDVNDYVLESVLKTEGEKLFRFYKKEEKGRLVISDEGIVKEFSYYSDNKEIFKSILKENKENE